MAEPRIITATLQVQFTSTEVDDGASQDGTIVLQADSRAAGLNGGRTQFRIGDPFGYLMFRSSGVSLTAHESTAGTIQSAGTIDIAVDEYITFANSREASVQLPIHSGFSYSWVGKSGGTLQRLSDTRLGLSAERVAVARVQYTARASGFYLRNVPAGVDRVLIVAVGEVGG